MTAEPLAVAAPARRNAYVEFVDAFFELGERRRYASTFLRLLRRPLRNAFALLDELDLRAATRFLQQSVVIYLAVAVTTGVAGSSGLVGELVQSALFLVSLSLELAVFYLLARRSAVRTSDRDFRAFLTFAAITSGFILPLSAVATQLGVAADPTAVVLSLGIFGFLVGYTVRAWQRFWGLSAKRAFVYLLVAAVASLLVPGLS